MGADNGHRYHRHPGLDRQYHGPSLELPKPSVQTSGALGENNHRGAVGNAPGRLVKTQQGLAAMRPVNRNIASQLHGLAKHRDLEKLHFGQPTEIKPQISLKHKDIKLALVIGGKDIRPALFKKTVAGHPDRNPAEPGNNPAHGAGEKLNLRRRPPEDDNHNDRRKADCPGDYRDKHQDQNTP